MKEFSVSDMIMRLLSEALRLSADEVKTFGMKLPHPIRGDTRTGERLSGDSQRLLLLGTKKKQRLREITEELEKLEPGIDESVELSTQLLTLERDVKMIGGLVTYECDFLAPFLEEDLVYDIAHGFEVVVTEDDEDIPVWAAAAESTL